MTNKYLEKSSSILGSIVATHLAQNLASRAAMRSPTVAKSLANAFAHGFHGKVPTGALNATKEVAMGAIAPDIAIMHKSFHDLGRKIGPVVSKMSHRQQLGLRLFSEGDFPAILKHGLHRDEHLQKAINSIGEHTGVPVPELKNINKQTAAKMQELWNSKEHPLLSNFSKHISRGKVSSNAVERSHSMAKPLIGAVGSIAAEPVAGGINTVKALAATDKVRDNKYLKKGVDIIEDQMVKAPVKKGISSKGKDFSKGVKNKLVEYGVNPTTASLQHTSSALSGLISSGAESASETLKRPLLR